MPIDYTTAAVDLGKTRCRVAVTRNGDRRLFSDAGTPGLATAGGIDAALAAILPLLERAGAVDVIGVGAAGAWTAPDAATTLALRLADVTGARVAVASDVVTAHVGALEGAAGTLLIAGTGAAALGVDDDGVRLIDGWGPELGDFGGGSWLGREGIRATMRAEGGLAPATSLSETVRAHLGSAPDAITWLAGPTPTGRLLATVAPLVLDAAEAGDIAAREIAAEAVRLLTASAVAASARSLDVAVHGGLTDHAWFRASLETSLIAAGRTIMPAVGDALHGAALLARRTDLPHERFVHRAE